MNFLLLLYLLAIAPKLLWDRVVKGKRHPAFLQRLGFKIPRPNHHPLIWIHAVSVGEIKAVQPLFRELRKQPLFLLLTTTSATGMAEAKRSFPDADAIAYLPLDFTWTVRRWIKKLNPRQFLLVESDFWPNLLRALHEHGTQLFLINGKISARSARRFSLFPRFSHRLFSRFDALCLQSEEYRTRFLPLVPDPNRLHVTGNLKLDREPQALSTSFSLPQPLITLSCTHAPEEEQLLDALYGGPWFLILAPRHPERFEEVAQLLTRKNIPFSRWGKPLQPAARLLLVDAMGQLPLCYRHSRLALVAGSYVSHIGGHNLLEPCLYGVPVLFGPHTFGQTEFATLALQSGAGLSVPLPQLRATIEAFFANPEQEKAMRAAATAVIEKGRGATLRTLKVIGKRN